MALTPCPPSLPCACLKKAQAAGESPQAGSRDPVTNRVEVIRAVTVSAAESALLGPSGLG